MRILALDTTAKTATTAIYENGGLKSLYTLNSTRTHSENMLPMIEEMMKRAECTFDDIDAFACAVGPGSFTGVRIGVALMKGIAYGTGKPCIGVSTLESLAQNVCVPGMEEHILICPVMDARRNQVYNALFEVENGTLERRCEDRAVGKDELLNELTVKENEKVIFVGDGTYLFQDKMNQRMIKASEMMVWQNAFSIACIAERMIENGMLCNDGELIPTYLRPSSAERMKMSVNNMKEGNIQ